MSLEPVNISRMMYGVNHTEDMDENCCSICFGVMDDGNVCRLDDCQHQFHSNCIVRWFRNGNSSCPCCRNEPLPADLNGGLFGRYKFLRKYASRKEAPQELKKLVEKIKKKEKYIKECHKNIREWKKSNEGKLWNQLDKTHKKLKHKVHSSSGTSGMWSLRAEIGAYPVLPIYIPQKTSRNR